LAGTVGRPLKRKDHVNIRFNIDKGIKKEFQMYCLERDITMQDVLEQYVFTILKENKEK
jgi:hypothetical protein